MTEKQIADAAAEAERLHIARNIAAFADRRDKAKAAAVVTAAIRELGKMIEDRAI